MENREIPRCFLWATWFGKAARKSECRNPKSERNPNSEARVSRLSERSISRLLTAFQSISIMPRHVSLSDFERRSSFGFRAADFGFHHSSFPPIAISRTPSSAHSPRSGSKCTLVWLNTVSNSRESAAASAMSPERPIASSRCEISTSRFAPRFSAMLLSACA